MGYDTHFHGMLEFTRPMTRAELAWIEQITESGHNWTKEISDAVWKQADSERDARRGGPLMFHEPTGAELAAQMQGYIVGKGLSAFYASSLRVADDCLGLVHASEKTYDMIGGVNFIIVNARTKIPDFGLKGMMAADTEFEPYLWFVKIGSDGMAYAEEATCDEFFAFRRKLYPNGYCGYGQIDPLDRDYFSERAPKGIRGWIARKLQL